MAKVKPKWAGQMGAMAPTVNFSPNTRKKLLEIVDNSDFIARLENRAMIYLIQDRERTEGATKGEALAEIEEIVDHMMALEKMLNSFDSSTDDIFRAVLYRRGISDLKRDTIKGLRQLTEIFWIVEREIEDKRGRKGADRIFTWLCIEIKKALESYGVKATTYAEGPFCAAISAIREEIGKPFTTDAKNDARKALDASPSTLV